MAALAPSAPPPCRVLLLSELLELGTAAIGMSVRVTGRIAHISEDMSVVELRPRSSNDGERGSTGLMTSSSASLSSSQALPVDVRLIHAVGMRVGALVQFGGEMVMGTPLEGRPDKPILVARFARGMDGLDEDLYEAALMELRKFAGRYSRQN